MWRVLFVCAVFVLGVLAATPIKVAALAISGGHSPRCLASVCVGSPLSPALARGDSTDELGGLTMIMCGERSSQVPPVLELDAILAGETCDSTVQNIYFVNGLTSIRIEVRDNVVAAIHTNPVHPITLP